MSENEKNIGEEAIESEVIETEGEPQEGEKQVDEPETDWESEAKKARRIAHRLRSQLEKATEKKVEPKEPDVERKTQKQGELTETQQLFLNVKGIEESDEVELVKKWMTTTGREPREIISNKIFKAELEELRTEKVVKNATPSSTKRGAQSQDSIAVAIAKYEQTGKLPEDFELRSAVVNYIVDKDSGNRPSWRN